MEGFYQNASGDADVTTVCFVRNKTDAFGRHRHVLCHVT